MDNTNKVEVVIQGKVYTIKGVESEEHIQKVVRYIDKKMDEVSQNSTSKVLNTNLVAIMAAINVADEYFKSLENIRLLQSEIDEYLSDSTMIAGEGNADKLTEYEKENASLKEKNLELQMELDYVNEAFSSLKVEVDELLK